jgi:hypothetical protein
MHDPMSVAFNIRSPFKKTYPDGWTYHEPFVTVWHVDPEIGGSDSSCFNATLVRTREDFRSEWRVSNASRVKRINYHVNWRLHFWHWRIQVHAVQNFKRWAWSRCKVCQGRFPWGYAPVSCEWYGDGPKWFVGEKHIMHRHCSESGVAKAEIP